MAATTNSAAMSRSKSCRNLLLNGLIPDEKVILLDAVELGSSQSDVKQVAIARVAKATSVDRLYNSRNESGQTFDIDPDASRFLMVRVADDASAPDVLRIIVNWTKELTSQR